MAKRLRIFSEEIWANVNKENKSILEDYVLELKSKKKSEGTIYQYTADLKMFFCWACENLKNKPILELKKRDFRKLWITRINAAARMNGLSYSRLMHGLKLAGIEVNRKMLADLAVADEKAFAELATAAKKGLDK